MTVPLSGRREDDFERIDALREAERGCWLASRQEPIFWPIRDTFGERPVFAHSCPLHQRVERLA